MGTMWINEAYFMQLGSSCMMVVSVRIVIHSVVARNDHPPPAFRIVPITAEVTRLSQKVENENVIHTAGQF